MELLFKKLEDNNVAFVILNSCNRWLGIVLVSVGVLMSLLIVDSAEGRETRLISSKLNFDQLQDFLGVFIVFLAIVAALITCHLSKQDLEPSLVGLAINYTLMVPVYINWVVKLVADIEMYVGAVERVQQFMEVGDLNSQPTVQCKAMGFNCCFNHGIRVDSI